MCGAFHTRAATSRKITMSIAELEAKFKAADSNSDGLVSVAELSAAEGVSATQAQSLIDYFAAGDEMTFSEYIVMTKVLKSDVSGVFKVSWAPIMQFFWLCLVLPSLCGSELTASLKIAYLGCSMHSQHLLPHYSR